MKPGIELRLNCPECGVMMDWVKTEFTEGRVTAYVYHCADCGPFHCNDTKPMTAGIPPVAVTVY